MLLTVGNMSQMQLRFPWVADTSLTRVAASCVFDLDATERDSYNGSGAWKNIVTEPSDGSAQGDYDFNGSNMPVFTGTVGGSSAYWLYNNSDNFTLPANTSFLEQLHNTGAKWSAITTFRTNSLDGKVDVLFDTAGRQNGIRLRIDSSGYFKLDQYVMGSYKTEQISAEQAVANTDYFLCVTVDESASTVTWYLNTITPIETDATSWTATTSSASSDANIGAESDGTLSRIEAGVRMFSFAMFNEVLTDTQVAKIKNILEQRHNRTYGVPFPINTGINLAGAAAGDNVLPGTVNTNYIYPTQEQADYFYSKGCRDFRISIRWERIQQTLGGDLDTEELGYLNTIVNYVTGLSGATAIIDIHNYDQYKISGTAYHIGSAEVSVANFADLWSRLATEFKNNSSVVFNIMNEPESVTASQWATTAQAAITAIRDTGAINKIHVPAVSYTSADNFFDDLNHLEYTYNDPMYNTVYEVHQYLDADGAGDDAGCSSDTIGTRRLHLFTQWCRQNGYKAQLGEFNAGDNSDTTADTSIKAFNEVIDYLIANNDVWEGVTLWMSYAWADAATEINDLEPDPLDTGPDRLRMTELSSRQVAIPHAGTKIEIDFCTNTVWNSLSSISDLLSITQSSSTYMPNADGTWSSVQANTLRMNSMGLLTEEGRIMTLPSAPFSLDGVGVHNLDVTEGIADPFGTSTATKLTDTVTDAVHMVKLDDSFWTGLSDGDDLLVSMFAKSGDNTDIRAFLYYGLPQEYELVQPDLPSSTIYQSGDWQRVYLDLQSYVSNYQQVTIGLNPDASLSVAHEPKSYVGSGDSLYVFHPSIEKRVSGTGPLFPTSPMDVDAKATSVTRDGDAVSITTGDLLTALQGDTVTFVAEVEWCPAVAVDLPLLTLNGTVALQRKSDYSAESLFTTTQSTSALTDGADAWVVPRKIGLSWNRTTGRIVVGAEGVGSVGSNQTIPTISSAALGPFNGFIKNIQVYDSFNDTTDLDTLLLKE